MLPPFNFVSYNLFTITEYEKAILVVASHVIDHAFSLFNSTLCCMKKSLLFLFFLLFSVVGFSQRIAAVQWMVGTWKINTPQGTIVEIWQAKDDSTLQGRSVFVKTAGDSITQEKIEFAYRNGDWYYSPTVMSQNGGNAIPFKVIFIRGTEFISENPLHDFPQRIAYRRIKQNMYASIEGNRNGKYGKQNFDFTSE